MADIKILLQAMARPWYIEPAAAQKYADIVDMIFSREGSEKWQAQLEKPVDKNFAFMASAAGDNTGSIADATAPGVAVINITGAIMKYDYCGAPGTQTIMAMIDEANASDMVQAILLVIDSPGGAVNGTQQLADKIAGSKKPVVAYISGMMASAAMWIGAAAKMRIASASTDMIGSIGTLISWRDASKMYAQMGITSHEVYATASTHKNIEFRAVSTEGDDRYQPMIDNILDPTNEEFMSNVKKYLPDANQDVYTGRIYMAKQAQKNGLIDKIGTFSDAINQALKLATKTKKEMQNQSTKFARTLAATGAENFEQLNEGIWLTEAHLDGVEIALESAYTSLVVAQQVNDNAQTVLGELRTELETMQSNLTTAQDELATANARIEALEKLPLVGGAAHATVDPVTTADPADKYLTSVDAEAERIRKLRE